MDKIICLVGESGSGKSTLAELLEKEGYNYIESYTTRKPRYKGERGHTFVDVKDYEFIRERNCQFRIFKCEKSIEDFHITLPLDYIAYTFYNGEHYFATREQYKGKGTSVYIIDPSGIKDLKENVTDAEIVVIYLKADEKERILRMISRAENRIFNDDISNICKDYLKEINDRLKHDEKAFKIIQCDYVVDANRSIEEVLKDVKEIIEGEY